MKVGIDLGGSHIAIGVVDENGRIIEKQERRILDKEKQEIKTFIEEYIIKNIKEMSKKYKITNIGIAIPGTVNKTSVIKSVNLNLENYNIVEALKKKINIPIKINIKQVNKIFYKRHQLYFLIDVFKNKVKSIEILK